MFYINLSELYNHGKVDNLDELVKSGKEYPFYGACGNEFKLGRIIFEAIEDPDDGYRSYLETIKKKNSTFIFYKTPFASVKVVSICDEDKFIGYHLIDVTDNHIWLQIWTDYYDEWYPCFVFSYHPKQREQQEEYLRLQ